MSDVKSNLKKYLKEAIKNSFGEDILESDIVIEIPKDITLGDYSSNVAMKSSKILKSNPKIIGDKIISYLKSIDTEIESAELVGPGFLNFKIKKDSMSSIINEILDSNENYGRNNSGNNLKILVEYVSANPTGDLHVGHARGAAWGDAVTRLYKFSGYDVLREYYINDAGNQIEMLAESLISRYFAYFNKEYPLPENGYHAQDVIDIANDIASKDGDKWLNEDGEKRKKYFKDLGVELELNKIKKDLKSFGVEFDSWIHEKMFYERGDIDKVLNKMMELGLTYEKEDALWFKTTSYGDDKDRVLRKKDGTLTYLVPDIANHLYKYERGYDVLVDLWGADHHGYVFRMRSALEALGCKKGTFEVDLEQMVRLVENGVEVKMSKRTGNAITLRELIEDVGSDAARYLFVSREVGAHFDFDLNLARQRNNDNPVYYAQYAYARAFKVVSEFKNLNKQESYKLLINDKEVELLKTLGEFKNVVIDASKTRSPNKICNYIQNLAGLFHSYYGAYKFNDETNLELSNERINLVKAISIVLKNAFNLIGVNALEKM